MNGSSIAESEALQEEPPPIAEFEPSTAREYVTIKLDQREREAVEYAARKSGKTVKEFVSEAAIRKASSVIRQ